MKTMLVRWVPLAALAFGAACAENGVGTAGTTKPVPGDAALDGTSGDADSLPDADGLDGPLVMVRDGAPGGGDASTTDGASQPGGDAATKGGDAAATDGATSADGATAGDAGAAGDGSSAGDGAAGDGGAPRVCAERETCNNGLDDNCNGAVDESCVCIPGQTQNCYDGDPARAGRGVCVFGTMRCEGLSEFGRWSECTGSGSPRPVVCGMGMDFNCNGRIDEGCACMPGETRRCYSGRPGSEGMGLCRGGMQTCRMTAGGSEWGPCSGEVLPAMRDLCDGVDRDCDGMPNTGCVCVRGQTRMCYSGPMGTAGRGLCRAGSQTCVTDAMTGSTAWSMCSGEVLPAPRDLCDGMDRDCDGNNNTGCACTVGQTRMCYGGPAGTAGVGACRAGTETCVAVEAGGSTWGPCTGEVRPAMDTCDGVDRNCDGNRYTNCGCMLGMTRVCYTGPTGTAGRGICRSGVQACVTGAMGNVWGTCNDEVTPLTDRCDGVDRDCDGNLNTGCVCSLGQTRSCYSGPTGTQNVGRCRGGTQGCELVSSGGARWGACNGEALPAASETCSNMVDDNCNGMVDEGCGSMCPIGFDLQNDPNNCGACGRRCPSGQACARGVCVGSGQLRITMVWDRAGDMDLHVVPPCTTEIYFLRRSACGGALDRDDIRGTGPENVFWSGTPASGTYLVCATPYGISGTTNYTVTVNRGSTVVQTWRGTRTSRSGYVQCSRSSPHFLGTFNYP